jgi:hypothetical protein
MSESIHKVISIRTCPLFISLYSVLDLSFSFQLVLDYLVSYNLTPDIKTFGIFALTCRKKTEAFVLLNDMQVNKLSNQI